LGLGLGLGLADIVRVGVIRVSCACACHCRAAQRGPNPKPNLLLVLLPPLLRRRLLTAVELGREVAVLEVADMRIEVERLLELVMRVGRHLARGQDQG
jgi:hypothetical protein